MRLLPPMITLGDNDSGPIEPRPLPIYVMMGDSMAVGRQTPAEMFMEFLQRTKRRARRIRRRARLKRRGY